MENKYDGINLNSQLQMITKEYKDLLLKAQETYDVLHKISKYVVIVCSKEYNSLEEKLKLVENATIELNQGKDLYQRVLNLKVNNTVAKIRNKIYDLLDLLQSNVTRANKIINSSMDVNKFYVFSTKNKIYSLIDSYLKRIFGKNIEAIKLDVDYTKNILYLSCSYKIKYTDNAGNKKSCYIVLSTHSLKPFNLRLFANRIVKRSLFDDIAVQCCNFKVSPGKLANGTKIYNYKELYNLINKFGYLNNWSEHNGMPNVDKRFVSLKDKLGYLTKDNLIVNWPNVQVLKQNGYDDKTVLSDLCTFFKVKKQDVQLKDFPKYVNTVIRMFK